MKGPDEGVAARSALWLGLAAGLSLGWRAPCLKLLGREPDPWRRTLGLGLRSEGTRFGLTSFGLRLPDTSPNDRSCWPGVDTTLGRFVWFFREFLTGEWLAQTGLVHHPDFVERLGGRPVDLGSGSFDSEGRLLSFAVLFDPHAPPHLDEQEQRLVETALGQAHREASSLSEIGRPARMIEAMRGWLTERASSANLAPGLSHAQRLLQIPMVSVEAMPAHSPERFRPPDFRRCRGMGGAAFDAVIRPWDDGRHVDLWLQVHHTAADGAPVQEMLARLERAWGTASDVLFPREDPDRVPWIASTQSGVEDRPVAQLVEFMDFSVLRQTRAALAERVVAEAGQPVPVAALLLWALARQREFAGRTFSTAVDVPADRHWPRGVDLVAIRPGDYFNRPGGFVLFVSEYHRRIGAARMRRSPSFRAMRVMSLISPGLASRALRANPARTKATFGTVGLSLLQDAKVFLAPMADAGWEDGFIAIGNMALPAEGGGRVGCVTVKGDAEQIRCYPAALRRALRDELLLESCLR